MTAPDPDHRPVAGLVADAIDQFAALVRGEVALARAEIEANLRRAIAAAWMLVGAAILALISLNVLAAALVAGIAALGLAPGWAALVVGLGFGLAALAFWLGGSRALRAGGLVPDRTARSLRRDATTLKEAVSHD